MLELLEQIIAQSGLLIHEAFERGLSSCFDDSKVEGSVIAAIRSCEFRRLIVRYVGFG